MISVSFVLLQFSWLQFRNYYIYRALLQKFIGYTLIYSYSTAGSFILLGVEGDPNEFPIFNKSSINTTILMESFSGRMKAYHRKVFEIVSIYI